MGINFGIDTHVYFVLVLEAAEEYIAFNRKIL